MPRETPSMCNATALRTASRRISQIYDDALAPSGLKGTQYAMLSRIDRHAGLTMNALASLLGMDRSTLGHNLRPLERDRLIALSTHPDDARARGITLSKKGRAVLSKARPLWARANERFEAQFGKRRARTLREMLTELASDAFAAAFRA